MSGTKRRGPAGRDVTRRGVLAGSAGLTFGLALGPGITVALFDAAAAEPDFSPNAWVTIAADGVIALSSPAPEMGQGVFTAVPMLFAEELDADWTKVVIEMAPHDPGVFGNPRLGNFMVSRMSRTVQGYWIKARTAGAQARAVLLLNVARKWNVPVTELTTEPNTVVHAATGRRIGYGEVAAFATMPEKIPWIALKDLKPRSEWRIIGSAAVVRADMPPKVNGDALFGIDTYVAGMLYAAVLRSPVQGNEPVTFNRDEVLQIWGVIDVVPLRNGVAVLADNAWAAMKGKETLRSTWKSGSPAGYYDSDRVMDEYLALARDPGVKGTVAFKSGDFQYAFQSSERKFVAEYRSAHVAHATMEPMNATAWVRSGRVDIWGSTQSPSACAVTAAKIAGVKSDKVTVHAAFLGGGFGRRLEQDITADAVTLSKITKKPVKVLWSRADDLRHDMYRPCTAQRIEASLDLNGNITAWRHRIVAESIYKRFRPQALKAAKGLDRPVTDGHRLLYNIPNQFHDYVRQERGVDVGFSRGLGAGYTNFAIETFIDELANASVKDPVEYRLAMLSDARASKVIRAVAHMAQWGRKRRAGRALGCAYAGSSGKWRTHVAEVVEISVDSVSGKITVHNVWAAVDPGVVVNPDTIVAQIEGAIIMGISQALHEKVTIREGAVQESNFHDYPILRMDETPRVHVKVLASNDDRPGGIGEAGLPPVAPAIANAVFNLTGARLRSLPFQPEDVLLAMEG